MATQLTHLEGSPFGSENNHLGLRDKWDHFRDEFRHANRNVLAVVAAGSTVVGLVGGLAVGRFSGSSEADPGKPSGNPGGVAVGQPFPSSSATAGNVIPNETPTSSGGFNNDPKKWDIECTDISITPLGNGQTRLKPVVKRLGGVANPGFVYTFVDYGNNNTGDVMVTAHGISPVDIEADASNVLGPVVVDVVYFPDGQHQPSNLQDIASGNLATNFPEAQIFDCPALTTEDFQAATS